MEERTEDDVITKLKPLTPMDNETLLPIVREEEPFGESLTLEGLARAMKVREGWGIWWDDTLIGAITLANIRWLHSIILSAVVDRNFHGRWCTRPILEQVFQYLFSTEFLSLRKVYSYAIVRDEGNGIRGTYEAAKMLTQMGFIREGMDRQGGMTDDGVGYDVVNFGMLKEECPWIYPRRKQLEILRKAMGKGVAS